MAPLRSSLTCPAYMPPRWLLLPPNIRTKAWYYGMWNLRSLFDNEGTVETARVSSEVSESEDRRIDLFIRELNQYNIKVAALQETKWFGNALLCWKEYSVDCWPGNISLLTLSNPFSRREINST